MKMLKKAIILTLSVLMTSGLTAQKITLEYCLQKAAETSPLAMQKLHYQTIEELNSKNISNTYLPSVFINGQASYQSDVFSFPNNPLFDSPIIPKDQYKLTLDVTQKIYDGGMAKNQRLAESAKVLADAQASEIDIYEIKTTVTSLYFSALMYQENIQILKNLLTALTDQQKMIDAQVAGGVVLKSAANEFRKQILTTEQQVLSASMDQRALLDMLGKWIGEEITASDALEFPAEEFEFAQLTNNRPELRLLDSQHAYMESMKNVVGVKRQPMLMAMAQAGIGQPNTYNFLETDFSDFYFVGLKLSWQILDFGTVKNEKSVLATNQAIAMANKQYFEKSIDIGLTKELAEVNKLKALLLKDDEIVSVQTDIVASAYSQLQNGVITPTEYLLQLNAKTQAELSRQLHAIQARQAEYNCLKITGNL